MRLTFYRIMRALNDWHATRVWERLKVTPKDDWLRMTYSKTTRRWFWYNEKINELEARRDR